MLPRLHLSVEETVHRASLVGVIVLFKHRRLPMATFAPGHLRRLRVENAETVARIEKNDDDAGLTNVQLAAATAAASGWYRSHRPT